MALVPIQGQWDEEGRYTPSEDEVRDGMQRWQRGAHEEVMVWHWIRSLRENTWLATALYFPCGWMGVQGVFLCLSTAESTRLSKENGIVQNLLHVGGIVNPEYLLFNVYFYPGMIFGNFVGFQAPDGYRIGTLEEVFN